VGFLEGKADKFKEGFLEVKGAKFKEINYKEAKCKEVKCKEDCNREARCKVVKCKEVSREVNYKVRKCQGDNSKEDIWGKCQDKHWEAKYLVARCLVTKFQEVHFRELIFPETMEGKFLEVKDKCKVHLILNSVNLEVSSQEVSLANRWATRKYLASNKSQVSKIRTDNNSYLDSNLGKTWDNLNSWDKGQAK